MVYKFFYLLFGNTHSQVYEQYLIPAWAVTETPGIVSTGEAPATRSLTLVRSIETNFVRPNSIY